MKTSFICTLATFELALSFNPAVQHKQFRQSYGPLLSSMESEGDPHDIVASSTFREIDIDMDRVQDCAEHFGKCSVKEIKNLQKDLHDKRIQNLVFGNLEAPEDLFKEKVFEEELALQLNLLRDETPPSYLFPEVEPQMAELPHLKDGTVAVKAEEMVAMGRSDMIVEELAEEGVLESLAICGLLGVMLVAPQFLGA